MYAYSGRHRIRSRVDWRNRDEEVESDVPPSSDYTSVPYTILNDVELNECHAKITSIASVDPYFRSWGRCGRPRSSSENVVALY